MDVLRIREDKLTSKLDRDVAVEARARFLASVANQLHQAEPAKSDLPETQKELPLEAVYLHRASMLRYEEYGEPGSIFPKDVVCPKCGILWIPSYVRVELWKKKRISNSKLKSLQEKQTHRPWMLSKLQKKLLRQHTRMATDPYRLRYECKLCGGKSLTKLPTSPNATGAAGNSNQFIANASAPEEVNASASGLDANAAPPLVRKSLSSTTGSTPGPSRNSARKCHTNKNRKSLLKQVTEMSGPSKLRSPLHEFLSRL